MANGVPARPALDVPEVGEAVEARMAAIRGANLNKAHWECEVDVYLQPPGSTPPFYLVTCLEMDGDQRIIFRNRQRPGFIVKFRLHDPLNRGYQFRPEPPDAVYSKAGYDCPREAIWEVFRPYAVVDGGQTLVVFNENPSPRIGPFQYNLRLISDAAGPWDVDPGGVEQNGNSN